jgi:hypothetical protein
MLLVSLIGPEVGSASGKASGPSRHPWPASRFAVLRTPPSAMVPTACAVRGHKCRHGYFVLAGYSEVTSAVWLVCSHNGSGTKLVAAVLAAARAGPDNSQCGRGKAIAILLRP